MAHLTPDRAGAVLPPGRVTLQDDPGTGPVAPEELAAQDDVVAAVRAGDDRRAGAAPTGTAPSA